MGFVQEAVVSGTEISQEMLDKIELFHNIEIVLISGVIIYQLYHSFNLWVKINKLKDVFINGFFLRSAFIRKDQIGSVDLIDTEIVFEDELLDEEKVLEEMVNDKKLKIVLVDTNGNGDVVLKIKDAINTYLINNFGAAVNFSIIKDIIDREVEIKDEDISQSISLPLYLGLAATMVGIILGLFSMPELNMDGFSLGVNALIGGVKIAMIGSLTGLACTAYLSSYSYNKAKRIVQNDKNNQLTYLQARLLPELVKAEDTGVSGLKASLDRFARVATNISDNVLIAANQTGENLDLQREVMEKVDNMKVLKVSKWNLELFDRLESNMELIQGFTHYISRLEKISSQLVEFSNRTVDINRVVSNIDSTLNESKDLTRYLSTHFDKIESTGEAALKAVGISEKHFEEAINSLKERTEGMINSLYKSSGDHEAQLNQIYSTFEENLMSITNIYIEQFKEAFNNSVPKFEQLDNLKLMIDINSSIKSIEENNSILNKLNSIDENLKNRSKTKDGQNNLNLKKPVEPKISKNNKKHPITLGMVINNIFKKSDEIE